MSNKQKKVQNIYRKRVTALAITGLLLLGMVITLIPGGGSAKKAKFSIINVLNGQFAQDYQMYKTQNAKGKKLFSGLNDSVQEFLGKRQRNGIYKGKDHYLLEEITSIDEKRLTDNITAIKEFDNTYYHIPSYFCLVPNKANILTNKLPGEATVIDQNAQFSKVQEMLGESVNWINVQKALNEHKNDDIYYKTDSRWTTLGAMYGYEKIAESMGLKASDTPSSKTYVVTNNFTGDLARASGYEASYEESLSIYTAKKVSENTNVVVTNLKTKKKSATVYDIDQLEKEDKYQLFLGKDSQYLDIKTTADTTERLLIFKDSFANTLIPMLVPYYREIVVIDTASYDESVQELMENTKFTSVLYLYSGNSFLEDKNLVNVLKIKETSAQEITDKEDGKNATE